MRRGRGSTDGTTHRTQLHDLLALVKTARELAPLVVVACPACGDAMHMRHLEAEQISDTQMRVSPTEIGLAVDMHLRLSCRAVCRG